MARLTLDEQLMAVASKGKKKKTEAEASWELERKMELERSIQADRQILPQKSKEKTQREIETENETENEEGDAEEEEGYASDPSQSQDGEIVVDDPGEEQPNPAEPEEDEEQSLVVPDLVGQDPDSAEQELSQYGLGANVVKTGESETSRVTQTEPSAGTEIEEGAVVTLYVTVKKEEEDEKEDEDKDREEEPEANKPAQAAEGAVPEAEAAAAEGAVATGAEAGVAAGAAASWPIWGTIIVIAGIVLLFLVLIFMVVISVVAKCNEDTWSGTGTRAASSVASWVGIIPADVCENLAFNGGASGGGGASGAFEPQLVNLTVPVKAGVDGRATACMADKVRRIYDLAQAATPPIEFEITGAYEPRTTASGGVSAHSRGEAVDIGLRPPASLRSNDPRIARLVAIARQAGFVPPAGDTLDEYANPAPNATAGHVHVEFNIPSDGGTFCK